MHAPVPTDRERAAVQAYLRLLSTVRAVLDTEEHTAPHPPRTTQGSPFAHPSHSPHPAPTSDSTDRAPGAAPLPLVPPSLLADADARLAEAGLAGNEGAFFALLRAWCPGVNPMNGEPAPHPHPFGT